MVGARSNINVFDRILLRQVRGRGAYMAEDYKFLLDWSGKILADRLCDIKRTFPIALQIGARRPLPLIASDIFNEKIGHLIISDVNESLLRNPFIPSVIADEEMLPFGNSTLDLILTNLDLHSNNDLPGVLLQIRKSLKPDGLFLGAMLGGETLFELRDSLMQSEIATKGGASTRVFPFADKQQMGALMQRAGFALPVVDSEIITVTYDTIFKLMKDLRGMGETNILLKRNKIWPGKDLFHKAALYYADNHSEPDSRIRASFEVIFLIGWSPHESQQQPLKPGSAAKRLSEALGVHEIGSGEKAKP